LLLVFPAGVFAQGVEEAQLGLELVDCDVNVFLANVGLNGRAGAEDGRDLEG
jgi:hypothetical protein